MKDKQNFNLENNNISNEKKEEMILAFFLELFAKKLDKKELKKLLESLKEKK